MVYRLFRNLLNCIDLKNISALLQNIVDFYLLDGKKINQMEETPGNAENLLILGTSSTFTKRNKF